MGIYDDVDHDNVEMVRIYILSENKTGDKQRVCMRNSHAPHHKKSSSTLRKRGTSFPQVLTSQVHRVERRKRRRRNQVRCPTLGTAEPEATGQHEMESTNSLVH